jgi:hypothetical protein
LALDVIGDSSRLFLRMAQICTSIPGLKSRCQPRTAPRSRVARPRSDPKASTSTAQSDQLSRSSGRQIEVPPSVNRAPAFRCSRSAMSPITSHTIRYIAKNGGIVAVISLAAGQR